MSRWLVWSTNAFPLWVLLASGCALIWPGWFTWFHGRWITGGLALVMLGMGLTLQLSDLKMVWQRPKPVAWGFMAQYAVMPLLGWAIAGALDLAAPFAVGLILVACCPGGTASNIVAFIARADLALSVVMTAASTLAAVVMTPLLTSVLVGARVEVDAVGLLSSTFQVVIVPVALGLLINRWAPRIVAAAAPVAPVVSVLTVALICASIIGQNAGAITAHAGRLLLAVGLLHAGGFALGYLFTRWAGYDIRTARTISIEVGMQNSGLGVVLARRHFVDPMTAVPAAVSSVFHSVLASLLVGWWRWRDRGSRSAHDPRGCSRGRGASASRHAAVH